MTARNVKTLTPPGVESLPVRKHRENGAENVGKSDSGSSKTVSLLAHWMRMSKDQVRRQRFRGVSSAKSRPPDRSKNHSIHLGGIAGLLEQRT